MENMNGILSGFTIFFVFTGLLVVGLSVPMIKRWVKPNLWYGFRTSKTLADEKVWYEANAYSGRLLFIVGISWVVAAVGLRYVPTIGTDLAAYNTVYGLIVMIELLAVVALSFWYLQSL